VCVLTKPGMRYPPVEMVSATADVEEACEPIDSTTPSTTRTS